MSNIESYAPPSSAVLRFQRGIEERFVQVNQKITPNTLQESRQKISDTLQRWESNGVRQKLADHTVQVLPQSKQIAALLKTLFVDQAETAHIDLTGRVTATVG